MDVSNDFFHPLLCHICKKSFNEVDLKKCSQCNMIQYCGLAHQKLHWPKHKEICRIIKLSKTNLNNKLEFNKNPRESLKLECLRRMNRMLNKVEFEMLAFPKICQFCGSMNNLKICDNCHSFFICLKHTNNNHNCDALRLKLKINLYLWKFEMPVPIVRGEVDNNFSDIYSFITKNIINEDLSNAALVSLISETLSRPLSLSNSLLTCNFTWPEELVVHILGGNLFETSTVQYWDILRKLHNVKTLRLVFVGPEVTPAGPCIDEIMVSVTEMFYHDARLDKPDVVCAFNSGIHEFSADSANDTWGPSLAKITALGVPIVLTSFNVEEAVLDVERFRKLEPDLRVRQFVNPFAGLTPILDPENLAIIYSNKVVSILIPNT